MGKKRACAILGNIYVETWHTYSSMILEGNTKPTPSYIHNYDAYDGKGWGILQWTYFSRKEALLNHVKKSNKKHKTRGLNVGDLVVQLEYFNWERKKLCNNEWKIFKRAKKLDQMVTVFCKQFENPKEGQESLNTRKKEARKCFKKFK